MLKDTSSILTWQFEDGSSISVGDMLFNDHERALDWLTVDEITMEPITGDPDELQYEPVFWCSNKDLTHQHDYSVSEINDLMRSQ